MVGAGGLGSPALLYLAASGVGSIGIVDYDLVDSSNLQRQIIHKEESVGKPKANSASSAIHSLNSLVSTRVHNIVLDSSNALHVIKDYNVVVDATDNVATRYLLNDACVLLGKPLVSGSALRMDGQLTVYNHQGGPCYRCVFPTPPPPETVGTCSDNGVLGVVPGIMGCMQALEAIKILSGMGTSYSQKLLLFDAVSGSFRSVKLRPKSPDCVICSDNPSVNSLIDYTQFCGSAANDKQLCLKVSRPEERLSCLDYYNHVRMGDVSHVLLDVREPLQFQICSLPGSLHIPLNKLEDSIEELKSHCVDTTSYDDPHKTPIYVVCRLGNDSQLAVQLLRKLGFRNSLDLIGGLDAWTIDVDSEFPRY